MNALPRPARRFLLAAWLMTAAACRPAETASGDRAFDLAGFLDDEARRLDRSSTGLHKTVTVNGRSETLAFAEPDWERELAPFSGCDINRAAWRNAFERDSVAAGPGRWRIEHTATERSIPVRWLALEWENDTLRSVEADWHVANLYYRSDRRLRYVPDSGYRVISRRKVIFRKEEKIRLAARFR